MVHVSDMRRSHLSMEELRRKYAEKRVEADVDKQKFIEDTAREAVDAIKRHEPEPTETQRDLVFRKQHHRWNVQSEMLETVRQLIIDALPGAEEYITVDREELGDGDYGSRGEYGFRIVFDKRLWMGDTE